MRPDLNKIEYLVGNEDTLLGISTAPVLPVFSENIVAFLSDLSKNILDDRRLRIYKDIAAYAYWIRKASILSQKVNIARIEKRLGRGLTFHISPSNIPIQFAVSMVPALLAGNACVIRVSSKEFDQVNIICDKINDLLSAKYSELSKYVCFIRYEHDEKITAWLSSLCNVRIIWGGNNTIKYIRQFPLPARSIELTFADRYSVAIINSDEMLKADINKVIDAFWLDTFYVDQNECSSPRLVVWTGSKKNEAREVFWDKLHQRVTKEYILTPVQTVNKLSSFTNLAMHINGIKLVSDDNMIFRVMIEEPIPEIMEYKDGGGYFFEYLCTDLEELIPLFDDCACQTVALLGINVDVIRDIVFQNGLKGVDRIVSLGKATAPNLDWDGYTLIESMSRFVEVED